jgi:tetratricopeptide (TPR) repeat protein
LTSLRPFSTSQVVAALGLPAHTVRSLIKSGYVTPQKGPRRQLRFSFQDIVVLRAAHGLLADLVPRRRITRALRALREKLPGEFPLAGLRISALGDEVIVQEKSRAWVAASGQGMLTFDLVSQGSELTVVERPLARAAGQPLDEWFDAALGLEETDPDAAVLQYRKIIDADAAYVAAYVNLGRLLHERNDTAAAEKVYREAQSACDACAVLMYNLGVLLEDAGATDGAIEAYQQALRCDPDHGDSHHNLARLFEVSGRPQHAIRHFNRYRSLTKTDSRHPSSRSR